jgi:hypothetical protein
MVERYKLSVDQSEQLRLMIMNRETPDFVVKSLELPTKDWTQYKMIHFIEFIYEGPHFVHDIIGRDTFGHPLGVEITRDEGLILRYQSQFDSYSLSASPAVAQFTPADFQIMVSLAYGPLLVSAK